MSSSLLEPKTGATGLQNMYLGRYFNAVILGNLAKQS